MSIYIAKSTALAARVLDGEMMIMSAKDSKLFTLNPIGTVIWQAADGKTSLQEIVREKICPEYDISPEQAMKDAEEFVNDLAAQGVLHLSDEPIPQGERP